MSRKNMTPELDSKDVLTYIRSYCEKKNIECCERKLQVLLYCCYGVYIAVFEARLTGEHPQAWPYGPVFPVAFNACVKGQLPVTGDAAVRKALGGDKTVFLDRTVDLFGKFSAGKLGGWALRPESPWSQVSSGGKMLPVAMDDFQIMRYFRSEVVTEEAVRTQSAAHEIFR
jgi:uncharacterized phage-associated protein